MAKPAKVLRHDQLKKCLVSSLFVTDEELALRLGVSVQTVRLDRLELGIPELRERTRQVAQELHSKPTAIASTDVTGDIVDLELGRNGLSTMMVTQDMVFEKTQVARGHFIFAQANSLALAVVDAPAAMTGVANIKFKSPVHVGEKLVAKAEVVKTRANKNFIWVKTRAGGQEVFRAKFIMVSLEG